MRRSASIIVEVLAVLFVVGLLAVVAIPDPKRPAPDSQHRSLIANLERVRTGIGRYWGDHNACYPSLELIQQWSRLPANSNAADGADRYIEGIPFNPYSNGNHIAGVETPIGESDWVYDPTTGVFKANDSVENQAL